MERYLEVARVEDRLDAEKSCQILEESGIQVLMRHIDIYLENTKKAGVILLVPSQFRDTARLKLSCIF